MGPTWVLSVPDGPHVGPMNLAIGVYHVLVLIHRDFDHASNFQGYQWHKEYRFHYLIFKVLLAYFQDAIFADRLGPLPIKKSLNLSLIIYLSSMVDPPENHHFLAIVYLYFTDDFFHNGPYFPQITFIDI